MQAEVNSNQALTSHFTGYKMATFTKIATYTVPISGTTTTITFSSIPSTYRHLCVAMGVSMNQTVYVRYNGNSSANYQTFLYRANAGNAISIQDHGATGLYASASSNDRYAPSMLWIDNYTDASVYRQTALWNAQNTSGSMYVSQGGTRSPAVAINQMDFLAINGTFYYQAGDTITLYGLS